MPLQIETKQTASTVSKSPIVGIDLGTTNSLVAYVMENSPRVLSSSSLGSLVPSVVSFADGKLTIGQEAKRQKIRDPKHTVFSVKRLLGRSFEDVKQSAHALPYEIIPPKEGKTNGNNEGLVRIRIGDQEYTAIEISAMILKELKKIAESRLETSVHQAVITVPAYFNDAQRQATRAAGRLAGWDVLRIINEPTAASLSYGLDKKRQGLIAVYDLGGGTFDISILKLHDGIFEVLSTHGDTALGGDDIDSAMARVAGKEIQELWGIDCFAQSELLAALLEAAEATKIALSEKAQADFAILLPEERHYKKTWTLRDFEAIVKPILDRTREPCLKALQDAGLQASDLSDVVLVGGPTRLKVVQDQVQSIFERSPNTSVHPDEVVALGAAIQADILAGNNRDLLLLDVVPLSLGVETYGGLMSSLIPRNTRIPAVARETFTTFVDKQTGVDIHVLQGERDRAEENRSLARFKLKGIPPQPAGMPRIEVTFMIDADGILQVSAQDLKTGHEQTIEVRPSFGLTDEEVERMLQNEAEHAEQDIAYRRLVDARNQALPILRAVEKQLPLGAHLLQRSQVAQIETAVEKLKKALEQTDAQAIHLARTELDQLTIPLAELILKGTD